MVVLACSSIGQWLTIFSGGYFYFRVVVATASGGCAPYTSILHHSLAAILPVFIVSTHVYFLPFGYFHVIPFSTTTSSGGGVYFHLSTSQYYFWYVSVLLFWYFERCSVLLCTNCGTFSTAQFFSVLLLVRLSTAGVLSRRDWYFSLLFLVLSALLCTSRYYLLYVSVRLGYF